MSPERRGVDYLMRLAHNVPSACVQRQIKFAEVLKARDATVPRVATVAIFVKAFAMVADEFPELRRAFIRYPWPHFYEYPTSIAATTVERIHNGAATIFPQLIKRPSAMSLRAVSDIFINAQKAPIESIRGFDRFARILNLPWFIAYPVWWLGYNIGRIRGNHFGSFAVTTIASLGAESPAFWTPVTTTLNYGAIRADGSVNINLMIDHRVMDGRVASEIIIRLEEIMNGPMIDELRSLAPQ